EDRKGVGHEPRADHQRAAEDHHRAVEGLARGDPAFRERLVEARPYRASLRARQARADEAGEHQQRERRHDADLLADLDDHVELQDRQADEDQDDEREHPRQRLLVRGQRWHPRSLAGKGPSLRLIRWLTRKPSTKLSRRSSTPSSGWTLSRSGWSTAWGARGSRSKAPCRSPR